MAICAVSPLPRSAAPQCLNPLALVIVELIALVIASPPPKIFAEISCVPLPPVIY